MPLLFFVGAFLRTMSSKTKAACFASIGGDSRSGAKSKFPERSRLKLLTIQGLSEALSQEWRKLQAAKRKEIQVLWSHI